MKLANSEFVNRSSWYSPVAFLKATDNTHASHIERSIKSLTKNGTTHAKEYHGVRLFLTDLEWDSRFFGVPTVRVEFLEWNQSFVTPDLIATAISACLRDLLNRLGRFYLFVEIPSEDIFAIQAFNMAGARLVETRVSYYRTDIAEFEWPKRSPVRMAGLDDISDIRRVASTMRNRFDRFHADANMPSDKADEFLATFAENSIRGFADFVLVPDSADGNPGAFLTAKLMSLESEIYQQSIAKMVLSAVDETRSGWYVRLVAEMSYLFRDKGVRVAFMTTQSTNRAVIRVWERLGYRYGRCTHVMSIYQSH